ncbi:hypothetical protein PIB30_031810 [Stylosanthes scabra]|uniref:Beta-galactosidase beta-sandwich domain-containing protein n=1 Tax=Stylosanthes scabra TaxID=79078 RepID=A0ABU6QCD7_9FABA|nr:hypothetical protein [Stylosanthes scabra]
MEERKKKVALSASTILAVAADGEKRETERNQEIERELKRERIEGRETKRREQRLHRCCHSSVELSSSSSLMKESSPERDALRERSELKEKKKENDVGAFSAATELAGIRRPGTRRLGVQHLQPRGAFTLSVFSRVAPSTSASSPRKCLPHPRLCLEIAKRFSASELARYPGNSFQKAGTQLRQELEWHIRMPLKVLHRVLSLVEELEHNNVGIGLGRGGVGWGWGKRVQDRFSACAAFLANYNTKSSANVSFGNEQYELPPWSISTLSDCKTAVFNTARIGAQSSQKKMTAVKSAFDLESYSEEPASSSEEDSITANALWEQINITRDSTDYLWYMTE